MPERWSPPSSPPPQCWYWWWILSSRLEMQARPGLHNEWGCSPPLTVQARPPPRPGPASTIKISPASRPGQPAQSHPETERLRDPQGQHFKQRPRVLTDLMLRLSLEFTGRTEGTEGTAEGGNPQWIWPLDSASVTIISYLNHIISLR